MRLTEFLSEPTLLSIRDDIARKYSRRKYEELLAKFGAISLVELREGEYSRILSKEEFIFETFGFLSDTFLKVLYKDKALSGNTINALAMEGEELEASIAGSIAEPVVEQSRLQIELNRHNLQQMHHFLDQSLENYVNGNYEAANAMTRSALEYFVQEIATRISVLRGGEAIPFTGHHGIQPVHYRDYLHDRHFLDDSEHRFLNAFYGYGSSNGSHPGISSEAEARLRRFVVTGIALLFLEKLNNEAFMNGLR